MGKLNNSDIDKISGGALSVQQNDDGKYDIVSTNVIETCENKEEAEKLISEFAERGAHMFRHPHRDDKDGGVHVRPGKFERKRRHDG